jgi:hypothetical protein
VVIKFHVVYHYLVFCFARILTVARKKCRCVNQNHPSHFSSSSFSEQKMEQPEVSFLSISIVLCATVNCVTTKSNQTRFTLVYFLVTVFGGLPHRWGVCREMLLVSPVGIATNTVCAVPHGGWDGRTRQNRCGRRTIQSIS